jgi:hypothetical protein
MTCHNGVREEKVREEKVREEKVSRAFFAKTVRQSSTVVIAKEVPDTFSHLLRF